MGFLESIKYCFTQGFFNFDGRASRSEFWSFFFLQGVLYSIGIMAVGFKIPYGINIFVIIQVILFIPNISVIVRRFHDVNINSIFILPFIFIAIMYGIAAVYYPQFKLSSNIYFIILILYVLFIGTLKGSDGANKYGDNPLITHHKNEVVNTHEFDDYSEDERKEISYIKSNDNDHNNENNK